MRSTWNTAGSRSDCSTWNDRTEPARRVLQAGLDSLSATASPSQVDSLFELACLLERWSGRMNLTGHRSLEAIVERLILDAAALSQALPEFGSLADLGSGAGLPGLPIAILRPRCHVTLVDSRERRHHFQRAAVREIGIANAEPLRGRVEDLEPRPHAAVIAQALARPERALAWMVRWAEPGGFLFLPGGKKPHRVPECPEIEFETCLRYRTPGRTFERTVWVGRRRSA
ncbi:MAG: 16S rRNA (guanine(527)-N(7))-methyltransferase RsmG [Myxococcales bacterium]|nr:16S rRNA (guanine(527)-N(7))-methyltransferase RsmG [Myxococcales bacterium]